MSLDLSKVAAQIGGMIDRLRTDSGQRRARLEKALEVLGGVNPEHLNKKIEAGKLTFMPAGLTENPANHYSPQTIPGEFFVCATDGSHIEVDRHRAARCFLLNTGAVTLRYGPRADAVLESFPRLYAAPEELVIPGGPGREQPIEGNLLGIKRSVEEAARLVTLVKEIPPLPVLALLDGSLILWGLEAFPDFVADALLQKGLLPRLDELARLASTRSLALASYISFPRSADVVNSLKVAICPREAIDSDRTCSVCRTRECDALAGLQDRELFTALLSPGERTARFRSRSQVVVKQYGEHAVDFFYLRLEDEVARVEVPRWVAQDVRSLGLAHGLILDQCRRGLGYPVALAEAHEQAVVTTADKENFWRLVEAIMEEEKLSSTGSAKSLSKKTRWI